MWLEGSQPGLSESSPKLIEYLRSFKDDLMVLKRELWDLHQFFTKPDLPTHDDGTRQNRNSPYSEGDTSEPPALSTNLLQSFKRIIIFFLCQSQSILHIVRENEDEQYFQDHAHTIHKWRKRCSDSKQMALDSIGQARQDLVLNITESDTTSVRLQAIGPELIAIVAMMNVQKGCLEMRSSSSSALRNVDNTGEETAKNIPTWSQLGDLGKAEQQLHSERTEPPPTSVDILDFCSARLSKLRYDANANPQRRLFMDLRLFSRELSALSLVNTLQRRSLWHLSFALDPSSFRITDVTRKARFPLEDKTIDYGAMKRTAFEHQLDWQIGLTHELMQQVQDDIEVLDEGHGNAIRVFTLVTLFFLPLSVKAPV